MLSLVDTVLQVTYLISDPERPPPNSYLVQQAKEDAFTANYYNRTGTSNYIDRERECVCVQLNSKILAIIYEQHWCILLKVNSGPEKIFFDYVGIKWRHYYGPNGPRAPPKLFMWPANEIGEVHSLESGEGKW